MDRYLGRVRVTRDVVGEGKRVWAELECSSAILLLDSGKNLKSPFLNIFNHQFITLSIDNISVCTNLLCI